MKKVLSLILALTLVLALAACGGKEIGRASCRERVLAGV